MLAPAGPLWSLSECDAVVIAALSVTTANLLVWTFSRTRFADIDAIS
ncbi:hypothetical protein [Curtobacterium sp. USHLN213]